MINKYIDHTLLKAFATEADILKLCNEAIQYDFKSVCVNPTNVKYAYSLLKNSSVLVCTVIGFPLGANTTETKVYETIDSIKNGASEIDMVINIGKAKEHDYKYIENEISEIRRASLGKTLKVIIETCYLTDEEKIEVCKAASRAKADFVKTSTGFGTGGAIASDIKLMKESISPEMFVKASGGIKTLEDCKVLIESGASRIGASSGVAIMEQYLNEENTK